MATILPNGNVFISGGATELKYNNTYEIFDSVSKKFTLHKNKVLQNRNRHSLNMLDNDKIFICGGYIDDKMTFKTHFYNIEKNIIKNGPELPYSYSNYMSIKVDNKIMICNITMTIVMIYNCQNNDFVTENTPLHFENKIVHSLHLLDNTRVLIIDQFCDIIIYDSKMHSYTNSQPLNMGKFFALSICIHKTKLNRINKLSLINNLTLNNNLTLIKNDNNVIFSGGFPFQVNPKGEVEYPPIIIYDINTKCVKKNLNINNVYHATLRLNKNIFLCGGQKYFQNTFNANSLTCRVSSACEIYDMTTHKINVIGNMEQHRIQHKITLLCDDKIFIAGGKQNRIIEDTLNTCEIYDLSINKSTLCKSKIPIKINNFNIHKLINNRILFIGNNDDHKLLFLIYNIDMDKFIELPHLYTNNFTYEDSVSLLDNRILICISYDTIPDTYTFLFYDQTNGKVIPTNYNINLYSVKSCVTLTDGNVLIITKNIFIFFNPYTISHRILKDVDFLDDSFQYSVC